MNEIDYSLPKHFFEEKNECLIENFSHLPEVFAEQVNKCSIRLSFHLSKYVQLSIKKNHRIFTCFS